MDVLFEGAFMDTHKAFGLALKMARKAKQLTQEDFALVSSRTYLSTLERGLKSPTLDKIEALAETMGIHPLTLVTLCYMRATSSKVPDSLVRRVEREIASLGSTHA
jgi:transcriptional regulator with XRE-family HTH domain